MGKGAEEWRAEAQRRQHADKENDVSRRSKEDCCRSTDEMGEGKGCAKEVRLNETRRVERWPNAHGPFCLDDK
jgi:hypothetical protein